MTIDDIIRSRYGVQLPPARNNSRLIDTDNSGSVSPDESGVQGKSTGILITNENW